MERKMVASLNTHSDERFVSTIRAKDLCAKLHEYGAEGFATTQTGVTNAYPVLVEAAAPYGLQVIEGIETDFVPDLSIWFPGTVPGPDDGTGRISRLILLVADAEGHKAFSQAVTESNNNDGMTVMTGKIIKKYFGPGTPGHGHVIATSAGIDGVVAMTLRENEHAYGQIAALKRKRAQSGYAPDDPRCLMIRSAGQKLQEELDALTGRQQALTEAAKPKYRDKEKYIQRYRKKITETELKIVEKEIEEAKAVAAEAAKHLEEVQAKIKKQKARIAQNGKEMKALQKKIDAWNAVTEEIAKTESCLRKEEDLMQAAHNVTRYFREVFGPDNFYMEVQNHGIPAEAEVFPKLVRIARDCGTPLVASNNVRTLDNSDEEILDLRIMQSMRYGREFLPEQPGDRECYLKTDDELGSWLSRILPEDAVREAMDNIEVVFHRCTERKDSGKESHYPVFIKNGEMLTREQADAELEAEVKKGISLRFPDGFPDEAVYSARLEKELSAIRQMGFSNYHLIVADYIRHAREYGMVGPGRGSAVGSLVCYLLGITELDPIRYGLLFERFLNPERVSMPDIDVDFANSIRQKAIDYVKTKYGEDSVCGIMTTNAQGPKGSLRIAAKYYGLDKCGDGTKYLSLADTICKKIPSEPGVSFSSPLDDGTLFDALSAEYAKDPDASEILRWAHIVEGSFTAYGAHAAGIVISDGTPLRELMPLRWNKKLDEWTTQMDMISVEHNGFLKMDFLGLKTLDIITDCLDSIRARHGVTLDPFRLPLDDSSVYSDILAAGNTGAVFQFESSGMRNMLRRFRPTCFDDLIILVAMFRPGPLQYIDGVIAVKNGRKPEYITEALKPILGGTYSAIVYQEQVMQIFQDLAGYTLGGADQVRRAMSKKKLSVLEAERSVFINGIDEDDEVQPDGSVKRGRHVRGCVANGISAEKADELFTQMTEFAKYAFNKSHAAAYALIGYVTAWLKKHYPAEFIAAAMNWAENDGIPGLMHEAKLFGVHVHAPDINRSGSGFTVDNGEILFGLGAVKAVGATADDIIAERDANGEFTSLPDFFRRVSVRKNALENLIMAGAFDAYCSNRTALLSACEEFQTAAKKLREAEAKNADTRNVIEQILHLDDDAVVEWQKNRGKPDAKPKTADAIRKTAAKKQSGSEERLSQWQAALDSVQLKSLHEDRDLRMKKEKELLGAYVTEHPLDRYPNPEDLDATPVQDAVPGSGRFYGVITEVEIKLRKKDRKPMAFIKLEDQTGDITVCFFVTEYAKFKDRIVDGAVVMIEGTVVEEERNERKEVKVFARDVISVHAVSVPSFHLFISEHLSEMKDAEQALQHCHDGDWFLCVYDSGLQEWRHFRKAWPSRFIKKLVS